MKSSALLLLLPLLGACNIHSDGGKNGDGNVTINADETGNIAFNVPFIQGQVKVPGSMMHWRRFRYRRGKTYARKQHHRVQA